MGDDEADLSTIRLLSAKAAAHLKVQSYPHARMVVRELSIIITYWEALGVQLDPIQREVVFDSIVFGLSSVAASFERAVAELGPRLCTHVPTGRLGAELHPPQGPPEPGSTAGGDPGQ